MNENDPIKLRVVKVYDSKGGQASSLAFSSSNNLCTFAFAVEFTRGAGCQGTIILGMGDDIRDELRTILSPERVRKGAPVKGSGGKGPGRR